MDAGALVALFSFYEKYQSERYRGIRSRLYKGQYDLDTLNSEQEDELRDLLNMLEFLGALVETNLLGFKTVSTIFYHSPVDIWPHVQPFVTKIRSQENHPVRNYARNYENLVGRYSQQ